MEFESSVGMVELTDDREEHIMTFHPEVRRYRRYFERTLAQPHTIRRSKYDPHVLIFYHRIVKPRYLAIVIKTNRRNFILTAYLTNRLQHHTL